MSKALLKYTGIKISYQKASRKFILVLSCVKLKEGPLNKQVPSIEQLDSIFCETIVMSQEFRQTLVCSLICYENHEKY